MATYGVTATGFVKPTLAQIQADIRARVLASLDSLGNPLFANINVDPDSPVGELIDVFAEREYSIWEGQESAYNAHSPNSAEGLALEDISQIVGVKQRDETHSLVYETFIGVPGTIVVSGFQVAVHNTEDYFVTLETFTIPGGGTVANILMASVETGPIPCYLNTLTDIMTANVGVTSVTNPADCTIGRLVETDLSLNQRRIASIQNPGAGTVGSIYAALIDEDQTPGIIDAALLTAEKMLILRPLFGIKKALESE
jgi:uncharacterized phage protein gp47/JayE